MMFAHIQSSPERRITLRLLSYWEKLRRDREMPSEWELNPEDIGDLWDNCFLVHTKDLHRPDYRFSYVGPAILRAFHGDSVMNRNDNHPHSESLLEHYTRIMNTLKPVVEEGQFVNSQGQVVKYRQCLVPLGNNGKVEAIFGGMRYKIFQA